MNDKDKHFIERYEELLDKGYCDCNEMNCIDNNSPRRILDIVKQLQSNWNSLREWLEKQKEDSKICKEWNNKKGFNDIDYDRDIKRFDFVLDKMNELESSDNK